MIWAPDDFREDYRPTFARDYSPCAHCPNEIEPGDAIVKRVGERSWSHLPCAKYEDDRLEQIARELQEQGEIRRRLNRRGVRDHHGRRRALAGLRPLKRKQRTPA